MTEVEARAALRDFDGFGGLQHWTADQSWKTEPDGWTVLPDLKNWHFRLRRVADGVQVRATAPGCGQPAVWIVSGPAVWTKTEANGVE
jgi:hypothetical protein